MDPARLLAVNPDVQMVSAAPKVLMSHVRKSRSHNYTFNLSPMSAAPNVLMHNVGKSRPHRCTFNLCPMSAAPKVLMSHQNVVRTRDRIRPTRRAVRVCPSRGACQHQRSESTPTSVFRSRLSVYPRVSVGIFCEAVCRLLCVSGARVGGEAARPGEGPGGVL